MSMSIETRLGCSGIDWPQLVRLYAEVGLVAGHGKAGDAAVIEQAFRNSGKVVTAWNGGQLVAAGRMLTDHLCYAMIFDVGVLPAYQQRGVGAAVMNALLDGARHLCIHLTSTFGNEPFYGRLGFKRHKTALALYPVASEYLADGP
jgi:GNAT superfamily N-acetyltransferase